MYKYEMHMHTYESSACGRNSIHDMIKKYKYLGFSGAVLTNHFFHGNTRIDRSLPPEEFVKQFCAPYFDGLSTAKELDFDLLFGVEENYGHGKEFLVYGITPQFLLDHTYLFSPEMDTRPYRLEMLRAWGEAAHAEGAVLALAHPFRSRAYIKEPLFVPDSALFDAVEVYNHCNEPEDNDKALSYFEGSDKILISGSDLHHSDFFSASCIATKERITDEKALANALKSREFERLIVEV